MNFYVSSYVPPLCVLHLITSDLYCALDFVMLKNCSRPLIVVLNWLGFVDFFNFQTGIKVK